MVLERKKISLVSSRAGGESKTSGDDPAEASEEQARTLVEELGPCLRNIARQLAKDSDGVEKLNKQLLASIYF